MKAPAPGTVCACVIIVQGAAIALIEHRHDSAQRVVYPRITVDLLAQQGVNGWPAAPVRRCEPAS